MRRIFFVLLWMVSFLPIVNSQLANDFKQHISYLADDKLKGRYTGSAGEKLAADYIIKQFQLEGIYSVSGKPNTKKYLQRFVYRMSVDSVRKKVKGKNVIAFIDNKAAYTVVLGAHYDHLGMGNNKYSAYRGEPAVHNGADDNASGVAMIIELAQRLKSSGYTKNNYLIIAFSGEELGLFGSKWFVAHPLIDTSKINYMLNFDMVGRVDSNKILVSGVGTSPLWKEALKDIETPLHVKTSESGIGPSDHTSFYLQNIPVLHFFSGQHKDYHKPSDDEEKINYRGMEAIFDYVLNLIAALDTKGKIGFIKTKDDEHENTPKFTVTMGVMPDYTYEGKGMRIDGVTEGKPAAKAGLKQGDVIIQLGDWVITDMMSYMKALAAFKKGDATTVKFKRGNEEMVKEVQF